MSDAARNPFEETLAKLLVPLSRMLVDRGVTIGAATEALKAALVEATEREGGADISDSLVSLRTGIHRKDVKRLRHAAAKPRRKSAMNALALVLNHWQEAESFRTSDGEPVALMRKGHGSRPGFDDLVRAARVDLAPGTVLAELLEQGHVEEGVDGRLRLVSRAYLPGQRTEARLDALEATLASHLDVAAHNLLGDANQARHFDRAVRYSHLSRRSVLQLEKEARDGAQRLLEEINSLAFRLQQADEESTEPVNGRFVLGAFVYPVESDPPVNEE